MNKTFTFLIFLIISQIVLGQKKDNKEPLLKFNIEINGEKHLISDGERIIVNGNEIKINSLDNKTFDFGILTFDYPKHFAFEFEGDDIVKNWTLDGNNLVISYLEYDTNISLDSFTNDLISFFKKENCEIVNCEIKLGNTIYNGKRIIVRLLGEMLTYDIYELNPNGSKSNIISFQDSKNEDGSDSKEGTETIRLFCDTIKIK